MKTICKSCGMAFPVNPEFIGCLVECQNCGAQFELREESIIKAAPRRPAHEPVQPPFEWGCFFLGLCLNAIGVFLALFSRGNRGAFAAFLGFLLGDVLGLVGYVFLGR